MIDNETSENGNGDDDDPDNNIENNKNDNNNVCGVGDSLPPTPTTKSPPHTGKNNNNNVVDANGPGGEANGNDANRGANGTDDERNIKCNVSDEPCGAEDVLQTTPTTKSPLHTGDGDNTSDNILDAGNRDGNV